MYRIIEKYFGEADEFNMKRAFSVYSLLFLLLMSFTYLLFYSAGKGPFQFEVDGLTYFSRIAYIGRYVRSVLQNIFLNKSLSFPVYDFRIGLGDDVFIYMWVGLLNPIILFTAPFFSIEHTEKLYWLICFLHMYLSGVSFLFFCSYKKMDVLASACGAIAYVFSGFALFYFLKHFLFIVPMILLPLMFLALEKVLHGEKPVLFIAMVVLAFLINFVFACMMIIMTFICGVFRFFDIYKEKRFKHFCSILFKCSVGFLTAVMLVAPFLFPVVFKFLESPRNLDIVPSGGLLLFNKYFVFDCITYLFAPGGMWGRTSMIPVCIFALVCLFKKKGDRGLKLFILFSFLGLVSPMVGYFFNAGKYVTDRWMFILPFVLAYAFTLMFHRIAKWRDEDKKLCIIATGAYALFVLISYVFVIKRVNMYAFYASIAMLSMVLLFSLLKRYNLTYRRVLLFCMTGFFALMNIYFLYSTDYVNYLKTFGPKDRAYIVFNELSINMLDEIEIPYSYSFFRSDATNVYPLFSYNLVKQYGLTGYTSLLPPVYADSQFALENIGAWHFYRIQGFNERAALDTLASVKYFIAPRGKEALVPYGFIRIAEDENNFLSYSVFENNYFLPIGYTYSNYITQEDYKRLSALDKQETLLQTVVLEISPHGFGKSRNLKFSEVSVPCNITNMDGVEWDDGVLRINKKMPL
ncbi:YfhO family protein [Synergistes jonesii]|uniref:YfhO family protein n=1 Tax=Synergistes jonesii TaxID=2754 RepID=UPI0008726655|nr:YfhO family protein [Synergistes jonesii]OFB67468.1 hypothetical protein JS78_08215 [Synergistes jonesii]